MRVIRGCSDASSKFNLYWSARPLHQIRDDKLVQNPQTNRSKSDHCCMRHRLGSQLPSSFHPGNCYPIIKNPCASGFAFGTSLCRERISFSTRQRPLFGPNNCLSIKASDHARNSSPDHDIYRALRAHICDSHAICCVPSIPCILHTRKAAWGRRKPYGRNSHRRNVAIRGCYTHSVILGR